MNDKFYGVDRYKIRFDRYIFVERRYRVVVMSINNGSIFCNDLRFSFDIC